MSGSRGEANFVWKCKMCKVSSLWKRSFTKYFLISHRENLQLPSSHLLLLTPKPHHQRAKRSWSSTVEDLSLWNLSQRYVSMFTVINGTNVEQGEWLATGLETGTKFTAIDLIEDEWYDYDDKSSEEVSIKDLKWEIRKN